MEKLAPKKPPNLVVIKESGKANLLSPKVTKKGKTKTKGKSAAKEQTNSTQDTDGLTSPSSSKTDKKVLQDLEPIDTTSPTEEDQEGEENEEEEEDDVVITTPFQEYDVDMNELLREAGNDVKQGPRGNICLCFTDIQGST
eukprot:gene5604-15703_t